MPRLGRRPGSSGSRAAILSAARRHFGDVGYERATIRAIVTDSVIPAVFRAGTNGLGERVASFFLTLRESEAGPGLVGMLRSVHTSDKAAAMMREFISSELLSRVAPTLTGRDRELRATLVVSHLIGVARR